MAMLRMILILWGTRVQVDVCIFGELLNIQYDHLEAAAHTLQPGKETFVCVNIKVADKNSIYVIVLNNRLDFT